MSLPKISLFVSGFALLIPLACHPSSSVSPHSSADPAHVGRIGEENARRSKADAALAARIDEVRARHDLPGIAALALDKSGVIAQAAGGVRSLGADAKILASDRFHLGSCTKAMTATLIAVFVERHVLRFEDTLGDLFPDEGVSDGLKTATLEQVLAHEAGLSDAWMTPELFSGLRDDSRPLMEQRRRLASVFLGHAPAARPGTHFEYANIDYVIAGAALERRTGKAWETLIVEHLFEPLGMRSCGFGSPARPGGLDAPWGHAARAGKLVPVPPGPDSDNPPAIGPAGTVHCSLSDWGRFALLHVRGEEDPSRLLTKESFGRLHRPYPGSDYALGWIATPRPWAGGLALTHSGSNTLFFATLWAAPGTGRAYLAATNAAPPEAARALDELIAFLIQQP